MNMTARLANAPCVAQPTPQSLLGRIPDVLASRSDRAATGLYQNGFESLRVDHVGLRHELRGSSTSGLTAYPFGCQGLWQSSNFHHIHRPKGPLHEGACVRVDFEPWEIRNDRG